MWRFREFLPITSKENPISLGEGDTPLLRTATLGREIGHKNLWVKDEATNPTGSCKARGMSAAVTRAVLDGTTCV